MKNARETIKEIINKSDYDIYLDMINRDISGRNLPDEKKVEVITKSMQTAVDCYNELLNMCGEQTITKYAIKLQVEILYVKEKPTKYYTYIGLFNEKKKLITINIETVRLIKEFAEQFNLLDLVDVDRIKDTVTAHELFHYFELIKPDLYTNQKIIDAKIFGLIKTKSYLMVSGEIAAMHFAKLLTNLKHSPLVYNKIFALGKKQVI